jgi:hypothetical protein
LTLVNFLQDSEENLKGHRFASWAEGGIHAEFTLDLTIQQYVRGDGMTKLARPASSKGDAAHALTKAGLSMIPFVGGPAVELFQLLVQPPLEKRRAEWMQEVGEKLEELEAQGLDLETLQQNEQFISTVMQATQAALRTHVASKREALRNAVLNVAVGQAPDETVQHLLLEFVDTLTEMHLRILQVFHDASPPPGMSMGGLADVLEHHIPSLRGRRDIYDQLWKDLHLRGLVSIAQLHMTMSESGLTGQKTTGLGESLLKFIAEPT